VRWRNAASRRSGLVYGKATNPNLKAQISRVANALAVAPSCGSRCTPLHVTNLTSIAASTLDPTSPRTCCSSTEEFRNNLGCFRLLHFRPRQRSFIAWMTCMSCFENLTRTSRRKALRIASVICKISELSKTSELDQYYRVRHQC